MPGGRDNGPHAGLYVVLVRRQCVSEFPRAIFSNAGSGSPAGFRSDRHRFRLCSCVASLAIESRGGAAVRVTMTASESIKMAWKGLGANKLRSALTTCGISIGVFSIISVMTAISGWQTSMETGLSYPRIQHIPVLEILVCDQGER